MKKTFLSWDCANKSLAWSLIEINTDVIVNINECIVNVLKLLNPDIELDIKSMKNQLNILMNFIDNFLIIKELGAVDLFPGIKVSDAPLILRAEKLNEFLKTMIINKDVHVIIEYQPPRMGGRFDKNITNHNSTIVQHQLMYHFINNGNKVDLISPKLKEHFYFKDEYNFDECKDKNYNSRKSYSAHNMLYYVDLYKRRDLLSKIKNNWYTDVADSFIQIFAFLHKEKFHKFMAKS